MKLDILIPSLIRDDLINSKLVNGLISAGMDASDYYLHLSDTVFHLMGFIDSKVNDGIYEEYLEMCKRIELIEITDWKSIQELANDIYIELNNCRLSGLN